MSLVTGPLRGPAGRRAVVAAAVIGLLALSLSAAEGGMHQVARPRPGRTSDQPAQAAPGPGSSSALAAGIRLLHQAVRAARRISYRGVQVISWRAPGGSGDWLGSGASRLTVDVWHRRGAGTLTRVALPSSPAWPGPGRGRAGATPGGVLGLSPELVGLLCTHYAMRPEGTGMADGRPARIVEAFRRSGTLAARFWLDRVTSLPLRRQLFDPDARLISDDDLVGLTLGARPARRAFTPAAAAGGQPAAFRPWAGQLGPARLAALRAGGWPVPGPLPDGLTLVDASQSATAAGRVVDLAYSDGLSVVSVFVQRGRLPSTLRGWRQTDLDGNRLYVANPGEPDLTWSARGFVYTVVAGAPAPTVAAVVNALPHQGEPGFWDRIKRGLRRLLSWVNPFR